VPKAGAIIATKLVEQHTAPLASADPAANIEENDDVVVVDIVPDSLSLGLV
jgi:hypothetical protein